VQEMAAQHAPGRQSMRCVEFSQFLAYFTYILRSLKDNGYYFGHSSSLEARLKKHNSGRVRSTKNRIPFVIHYYEVFETKSEAFRREIFFKSLDGRKWLFEKNIISPR
jgi:putative endonuclease